MTLTESRKAVTDHLLSMGLDTSDVLEIEDLVDTAVRVAVERERDRLYRMRQAGAGS